MYYNSDYVRNESAIQQAVRDDMVRNLGLADLRGAIQIGTATYAYPVLVDGVETHAIVKVSSPRLNPRPHESRFNASYAAAEYVRNKERRERRLEQRIKELEKQLRDIKEGKSGGKKVSNLNWL